jgi:hypothetical protein
MEAGVVIDRGDNYTAAKCPLSICRKGASTFTSFLFSSIRRGL